MKKSERSCADSGFSEERSKCCGRPKWRDFGAKAQDTSEFDRGGPRVFPRDGRARSDRCGDGDAYSYG